MAMTYQQQYVLDGSVARDAILNLTARHNRYFSEGDRSGWIATFRHSGARFTRDGVEFTDLREAFDGGNGRLVTVDRADCGRSEVHRERARSRLPLRSAERRARRYGNPGQDGRGVSRLLTPQAASAMSKL